MASPAATTRAAPAGPAAARAGAPPGARGPVPGRSRPRPGPRRPVRAGRSSGAQSSWSARMPSGISSTPKGSVNIASPRSKNRITSPGSANTLPPCRSLWFSAIGRPSAPTTSTERRSSGRPARIAGTASSANRRGSPTGNALSASARSTTSSSKSSGHIVWTPAAVSRSVCGRSARCSWAHCRTISHQEPRSVCPEPYTSPWSGISSRPRTRSTARSGTTRSGSSCPISSTSDASNRLSEQFCFAQNSPSPAYALSTVAQPRILYCSRRTGPTAASTQVRSSASNSGLDQRSVVDGSSGGSGKRMRRWWCLAASAANRFPGGRPRSTDILQTIRNNVW